MIRSTWRVRAVRRLLVVAVVAAGVLCAANVAFADLSLPATVTGFVRSGGGAAIASATVRIDGETSSTIQPWFSQTATTAADGKFVITDVIQGTYQMYVNEHDGYPLAAWAENWFWHEDISDGTGDTRHLVIGGTSTSVTATVVTLRANGVVNVRAMDGAMPVAGSTVRASINDGGASYTQWGITRGDGWCYFTDAQPGEWSVTMVGSGQEVPIGATAGGDPYSGNICETMTAEFTVAAGATVTRPAVAFQKGERIHGAVGESYGGYGYGIPSIAVSLQPSDPDAWPLIAYTDDLGNYDAWVPPGTYELTLSDANDAYVPVYDDLDWGGLTFAVAGPGKSIYPYLTPSANTYAVAGPSHSATGNVMCWVEATLYDPSNPPGQFFRRVSSQGPGVGTYMIRLPKATGYSGNRVRLLWSEQATYPGTPAYIPATQLITPPAGGVYGQDVVFTLGGGIEGHVHDESGNAVPGVQVSASRRVYDAGLGDFTWTGEGYQWYTRTDAAGYYRIGGMPANSDYKVNFSSYYDVGEPLPIKYADYYRRAWMNRPTLDGLDSSGTPVVVSHDPVAVTAGTVHSGVDETITPGGYVGLHANGPEDASGTVHGTGAVWCDVMYDASGHWIEIDSGYSTGGTFEKLWKVLPVGHYRLDYADFFGRGSGSWEFDLGAGERKYTSVIVPAPVSMYSLTGLQVGGAFAGLLGGGLDGWGVGDLNLNVEQLAGLPPLLPPSPIPLVSLSTTGGVFDVTPSGDATGSWTLTFPYPPSVPAGSEKDLRVLHYPAAGGVEALTPIGWNTSARTFQVRAPSFSTFQVVLARPLASVGRPHAPSSVRRGRSFKVYGYLKPRHKSRSYAVKLQFYRYQSGKWVLRKTKSVRVANYSSYSKYSTSTSLRYTGKWRIRAYHYDSSHRQSYSSWEYLRVK